MSGTKMLVPDPLVPVDWEPGHPWIRLFDNTSHGCLIGLGSGEFIEARSQFPDHSSAVFFMVWLGALSAAFGECHCDEGVGLQQCLDGLCISSDSNMNGMISVLWLKGVY